MKPFDRRSFMRIAGVSLGFGALYHVLPTTASGEMIEILDHMGKSTGEKLKPFSFFQLSDTHVGFSGPPNPTGTKAFERAVEIVNGLAAPPDLVIFTGDLSHDSEDKDVHSGRMKQFQEIASKIKTQDLRLVPGEHDAGLDEGVLYREHFGETSYSFDKNGVHFVALDNVSRAKPEVGAERIAWLKKDLARFHKLTPIVVFTHRPLFDLKPDWEWFTSDGDDVMNVLAPFENVTVLYGHIHRDDDHTEGHVHHHSARSLMFSFPDPEKVADKKPNPFDKDRPFTHLGITQIQVDAKNLKTNSIPLDSTELSLREFSGTEGIQQILKIGEL